MKIEILFISAIFITASTENVLIETTTGKIKGKIITVLDKEVKAFLGIPYAIPPTGKLRFRKPQPIQLWNGVYDATKKSPSCVQASKRLPEFMSILDRNEMQVQEDCLYLNIWVPTLKNDSKPLSTMIWIYGGLFNSGSSTSSIYDGAALASLGNVIVASMNYRLGALGFLNIGSEDAPGNMGMWDQVEAFKWIRNNLEVFGGDPSEITLFGQSAGAYSISNHILSPIANGLFKRAIIQSGTSYNSGYSTTFGKFMAEDLGNHLGCIDENLSYDKLMNCLRNVNASQVTDAANLMPNIFSPNYGNEFLPIAPNEQISEGKFNNVEVLMGNVMNEGSLFLALSEPSLLLSDHPKFKKSEAKESILSLFRKKDKSSLKSIFDEYLENIADDDFTSVLENSQNIIGDSYFKCPTILFADKLSKTDRKVYYYTFNHTIANKKRKKWMGVIHSEELAFVFGVPILKPDKFTTEEIELSKIMIKIWTSFAKTGTPSTVTLNRDWPKYSEESREHVQINTKQLIIVHDFPNNKCNFWKKCFKNGDCFH